MNKISIYSLAAAVAISISGCAVTVPKEMERATTDYQKTEVHAGKNIDKMRLVCTQNMLNLAPANKAVNIDARALGQEDPVTVEVNATLLDVGLFKENVPISYVCKFFNGNMIEGKFTSGSIPNIRVY